MVFETFFDEDLAQYSYIVGCPATGEALVVDPLRDIDRYIAWTSANGLEVTAVAETHIHADFLSGAREIAAVCDAMLYLSGETVSDWEYEGLGDLDVRRVADGEEFAVGNVTLRASHTPGHTPEHLTYSVIDDDGAERLVMSGDFLFVDDLGRPDLLESAAGQADTAKEWAGSLFDSVRSFLSSASSDATVWPGHGAGSACGKSQSSIPATTVGREARAAWWSDVVDRGDRDAFVDQLLDGQPETPHYFARMKQLNRDGMEWFGGRFVPPRVFASTAHEAAESATQVIDVRGEVDFARGHLDGALSLPLVSLSTFAGWVLEYDRPILLAAGRDEVEEATRKLARIGLDDVLGWVELAELPATRALDRLTADETRECIVDGEAKLLDVRSASEAETQRIPGSLHVHYGSVREQLDELDLDEHYVVHCATGRRATLAASLLQAEGFDVAVFPGGPSGWREAGFELD